MIEWQLDSLQAEEAPRLRIGSSVTLLSRSRQVCELKGSAAVVLAWVALEGHADRRRVSALLWPESDPAQARSNLRVLTHRINQKFGDELLVGSEHLELSASRAKVELYNVEELLAALAAGGAARCEWLAEAGAEAGAGEELQTWLRNARQRVKQAQLARLGEALTEALTLARHRRALALAKACVQLDPLSEHRHRQLMDLLVRCGDRAAALSAYEECRDLLKEHLGVLPSEPTRLAHLRMLQEQSLGSDQPSQATLEGMLPAPAWAAAIHPLVEREAALAHAEAALKKGVHVVVQGEPGVGKTRLLRHLVSGAVAQTEQVVLRAALQPEPYAALAQLLQEVQARRKPHIGTAEQTELARLVPLAFSGVKPSASALSAPRLHAALQHWFARLRDVGVQLLLLDDVQYADASSQAAFASLLEIGNDAPGPTPALLMAHRSAEIEAVLDQALTRAQAKRRALRIELPRLTPAGVQVLLAALNGGIDSGSRTGEPGALAQHLHKRTGGNPLFVIELARQALEHGDTAGSADLQALLGTRLQGCSATAQQLAAVSAVAPEEFTVELAAAVTAQTALSLMPAWRELQQKGLFAEHGLAHDLIQDAVRAALPQPIRRVLHGQIAQYLEDQGRRGAAVQRHWMEAGDADRALPHAVHQLYAVSAAGLPTAQQELAIFELLERVSEPLLMEWRWLTAEIERSLIVALPADDMWNRVRALRQRVERQPGNAGAAAWVAYETARSQRFVDASPKEAYSTLAAAADAMPQRGVERAFVESALARFASNMTGTPLVHLQRACEALADLPEQPRITRLRKEIDGMLGVHSDQVEQIRKEANRWRAARRRCDVGVMAEACARMATLQGYLGYATRALSHFTRGARLHAGSADGGDSDGAQGVARLRNPEAMGRVALNAGHYALSQQLLISASDRLALLQNWAFLAVLHLRLGDWRKAEEHAKQVTPEALSEYFATQIIYMHVRAELDGHQGRDPLPGLKAQLVLAQQHGLGGLNLNLVTWEVDLRSQPLALRLVSADNLLARLRHHDVRGAKLAKALLEIAEVHAEAAAPGWESLATEAARHFRRGCANATVYLPEALLRCARLVRRHDAAEAAALVHVARRWVHNALRHLPPGAEEGFTQHVLVNRLLLGHDEEALFSQPLH